MIGGAEAVNRRASMGLLLCLLPGRGLPGSFRFTERLPRAAALVHLP